MLARDATIVENDVVLLGAADGIGSPFADLKAPARTSRISNGKNAVQPVRYCKCLKRNGKFARVRLCKSMIYFDNNATTCVMPPVFDAMRRYLDASFGNPSSAHAAGREARAAIEKARHSVAYLIGAAEPS